ncbi:Cell-cell adhesion protein, partial [Phytophthora megakarya]
RTDERIDQLGQYVAEHVATTSTAVSQRLDEHLQVALEQSQAQLRAAMGTSFIQHVDASENRIKAGLDASADNIQQATNTALQECERTVRNTLNDIRSSTSATINESFRRHAQDCERRLRKELQKSNSMGDERAQLYADARADELEKRINESLKTSMAILTAESNQQFLETDIYLRRHLAEYDTDFEHRIDTKVHELTETLDQRLEQHLQESIKESQQTMQKKLDDISTHLIARVEEAVDRTRSQGQPEFEHVFDYNKMEIRLQDQLLRSQEELQLQIHTVENQVQQNSIHFTSTQQEFEQRMGKHEAQVEARFERITAQFQSEIASKVEEFKQILQNDEHVTSIPENFSSVRHFIGISETQVEANAAVHGQSNMLSTNISTAENNGIQDGDNSFSCISLDSRDLLAVLNEIKSDLTALHETTAKANGAHCLLAARHDAIQATKNRANQRARALRHSASRRYK